MNNIITSQRNYCRRIADLPFPKQFKSHERKHQKTEHEEQENIQDLWQGISDASESSAKLKGKEEGRE